MDGDERAGLGGSRTPSFLARQHVRMRRIGPARSGQGLVLALPNIHGLDTDILPLARRALRHHEVWSVCLDLDRGRQSGGEAWVDSAKYVADQILASAMPRPAALVGFSIGGYLGWMIDRMLVGSGLEVTPVINLDGGVMHLHRTQWWELIRPFVPSGPETPEARMLLAHSAAPGGLLLYDSSRADWREIGVPVQSLPFRTVSHPDFHRPAAIDAGNGIFRAFIERGGRPAPDPPAGDPPAEIALDTVGGRIFEALAASERPDVATVRSLVATGLSVNANVMSSLLFLSAATGDAEFALDVARRVRALAPRFKPASHAALAVARAAGREPNPHARSESARPEHADGAPAAWGWLSGVVVGSEESLDFAASFCRPSTSRSPHPA